MLLVHSARIVPFGLILGLVILLDPTSNARSMARRSQDPATSSQPPSQLNRAFENPDVDRYRDRFESESREVYLLREQLVEASAVRPGLDVADVGAGTGFFTVMFAQRIGEKGTTYAVDIAPAFLESIDQRAQDEDLTNIRTVLCDQSSTKLEPASVDLVFICDTYHHFENPEQSMASIHRALRPGGTLVLVEFDRREGISSDFIMNHVRADRATFTAEIEQAGFETIPTEDAPKLIENFFQRFRKIERD